VKRVSSLINKVMKLTMTIMMISTKSIFINILERVWVGNGREKCESILVGTMKRERFGLIWNRMSNKRISEPELVIYCLQLRSLGFFLSEIEIQAGFPQSDAIPVYRPVQRFQFQTRYQIGVLDRNQTL